MSKEINKPTNVEKNSKTAEVIPSAVLPSLEPSVAPVSSSTAPPIPVVEVPKVSEGGMMITVKALEHIPSTIVGTKSYWMKTGEVKALPASVAHHFKSFNLVEFVR